MNLPKIVEASCVICKKLVGEPSLHSSSDFDGNLVRWKSEDKCSLTNGILCEFSSRVPKGEKRDNRWFVICEEHIDPDCLITFRGGTGYPVHQGYAHNRSEWEQQYIEQRG